MAATKQQGSFQGIYVQVVNSAVGAFTTLRVVRRLYDADDLNINNYLLGRQADLLLLAALAERGSVNGPITDRLLDTKQRIARLAPENPCSSLSFLQNNYNNVMIEDSKI